MGWYSPSEWHLLMIVVVELSNMLQYSLIDNRTFSVSLLSFLFNIKILLWYNSKILSINYTVCTLNCFSSFYFLLSSLYVNFISLISLYSLSCSNSVRFISLPTYLKIYFYPPNQKYIPLLQLYLY